MKYEVAILGAQGFLGENLICGLHGNYSVFGVSRAKHGGYRLSTNSTDKEILSIFEQLEPGALVINSIGKLAHSIDESNPLDVSEAFIVNSEFPRRLSKIALSKGLRFIHISTDAVFSNKAGAVDEVSLTSPQGIYGQSKVLGEVIGDNTLTIRCSFVGPSVGNRKSGLWSWIQHLEKNAIIDGFCNQLWSGVTTSQLVGLCYLLVDKKIFNQVAAISSIHHFCPNPVITKYDLVSLIAEQIRPDVLVNPKEHKISVTRNLVSKFNSLNKLVDRVDSDWKSLIVKAYLGYGNQ